MRCTCCDRNLNDAESTARHPVTNEFLDTCNKCLKEIGITPVIRPDLNLYEEFDENEFASEEAIDWDGDGDDD